MGGESPARTANDSLGPNGSAGVRVLTLGYQGRSLSEVLEIVERSRVNRVIDVRQNPWSRKGGFSSGELGEALAAVGIHYTPLPGLGCTRASRHALWHGGPTEGFLTEYRQKLAEHPEALAELIHWAEASKSLLLCLERDPARCHRAVLGERLRAAGFLVQDL